MIAGFVGFFVHGGSRTVAAAVWKGGKESKAYEKNSDLSRQTGIDDGREETVLDLHPSKKELRKARRAERKRKRKDALLNDPFASK
jgi:hypothetical protein